MKPSPCAETLDSLVWPDLRLLQHTDGYRFNLDPVLLAASMESPLPPVMDLGCGSGVILLLLARRDPGVHGAGLEIQGPLAGLARRNVVLNRMADRIGIVRGDVRDVPRLFRPGIFRTVVVNPPYRKPGTGRLSPHPEKAPARHELLMTFDDLLAASAHLLAPGGMLFLCWKPEREGELARAADHGLAPVRLRPVRSRDGDVPYLLLVSLRRGAAGGHGFAELPPLTVYRGQVYAPEAAAILGGGTAAAPLARSTDRS